MVVLVLGMFVPSELGDSSLNLYLNTWLHHLETPNHFSKFSSMKITGYAKHGDNGCNHFRYSFLVKELIFVLRLNYLSRKIVTQHLKEERVMEGL
jgi:hypothetical protein